MLDFLRDLDLKLRMQLAEILHINSKKEKLDSLFCWRLMNRYFTDFSVCFLIVFFCRFCVFFIMLSFTTFLCSVLTLDPLLIIPFLFPWFCFFLCLFTGLLYFSLLLVIIVYYMFSFSFTSLFLFIFFFFLIVLLYISTAGLTSLGNP